jgi:hypothetical protein|tara:strand:+ start:238 stop:420 length:183 start_codon:yes stop_codon:yes gene_type:complete
MASPKKKWLRRRAAELAAQEEVAQPAPAPVPEAKPAPAAKPFVKPAGAPPKVALKPNKKD